MDKYKASEYFSDLLDKLLDNETLITEIFKENDENKMKMKMKKVYN